MHAHIPRLFLGRHALRLLVFKPRRVLVILPKLLRLKLRPKHDHVQTSPHVYERLPVLLEHGEVVVENLYHVGPHEHRRAEGDGLFGHVFLQLKLQIRAKMRDYVPEEKVRFVLRPRLDCGLFKCLVFGNCIQ